MQFSDSEKRVLRWARGFEVALGAFALLGALLWVLLASLVSPASGPQAVPYVVVGALFLLSARYLLTGSEAAAGAAVVLSLLSAVVLALELVLGWNGWSVIGIAILVAVVAMSLYVLFAVIFVWHRAVKRRHVGKAAAGDGTNA